MYLHSGHLWDDHTVKSTVVTLFVVNNYISVHGMSSFDLVR